MSTLSLGFWFLAFLIALIGGPIFIMHAAAVFVRARTGRSEWDHVRRHKWRWLTIPICALIFSSMFVYNWPLELGFRLSRGALERAAADFRGGKLDGSKPHWVGCYRVDQIYEPYSSGAPGGILFVTGHAVIDPMGFHHGSLATAPTKTIQTFSPTWRIAIDD